MPFALPSLTIPALVLGALLAFWGQQAMSGLWHDWQMGRAVASAQKTATDAVIRDVVTPLQERLALEQHAAAARRAQAERSQARVETLDAALTAEREQRRALEEALASVADRVEGSGGGGRVPRDVWLRLRGSGD